MRVYLFIEHYPNPYKPWIDTQLVQLLRAGHEVRILAEASFTSTIHPEVREWRLQEKTSYYPATLKGLRRDGPSALTSLIGGGPRQLRRAAAAMRGVAFGKLKLLAATRALLMPSDAPDVCYIHNLVAASRLTFLRRVYPSCKLCLYFHGGEVGGQPKVTGERAIFATMDAVITSTRFAAQQAIERGCDAAKIAIVPLGFHMPSYAPAAPRRYRPDGVVRFISVGRMSPEKGFLYALRAVQQLRDEGHRDFRYTLVGTGIQLAELKAFATQQSLGDLVHFAGEKTRAEVAAALEAADVFVLPSIVTEVWAETQATVVQEALLMGCLTVTTAAGGVPESNAAEMQPFAVPPADAAAIATQMRRLLALTADEMTALGAAGRRFATDKYDIAPLMERILNHAVGRLSADDPNRYQPTTAAVPSSA